MSSPFFGLNIGASALRTAQTLVDITNQNIANANTPGYSRQSAVVSASTPEPMPTLSGSGTPGQLGTGVMINTITRARDTFVDGQIRGQLTTQGEVDARGTALTQVEAIVNEPSTTGLSSTLSKYWSAWQEVANTPADSAVRANLVQQGAAVADAFHGQIAQFTQQQHDLDNQVSLAVSNVNTLANQIAAVNTQISQVETSGMHANDLRDQRDVLVDSLSKLVKINVVESGDGQLSINVGNHQLVDKQLVHPMVANAVAGNFTQVQWPDPTAATVSGGSPVLTGAAAGLGGTVVINGVTVTLTPVAATPKLTVAAINTAMGGAVTASLDSAGKLVLTSNVAGSAGSVTVGAITGSIATDLGIVTNILTPGADSVPVNLGGGQLKGLVDSRDVLLKERIDGVNALATRDRVGERRERLGCWARRRRWAELLCGDGRHHNRCRSADHRRRWHRQNRRGAAVPGPVVGYRVLVGGWRQLERTRHGRARESDRRTRHGPGGPDARPGARARARTGHPGGHRPVRGFRQHDLQVHRDAAGRARRNADRDRGEPPEPGAREPGGHYPGHRFSWQQDHQRRHRHRPLQRVGARGQLHRRRHRPRGLEWQIGHDGFRPDDDWRPVRAADLGPGRGIADRQEPVHEPVGAGQSAADAALVDEWRLT